MPLSEIHKKRLKKNLVILALVLGFCALVWITTMVRMANAQESAKATVGPPFIATQTNTGPMTGYTRRPADVSDLFIDQRSDHLETQQDKHKTYMERGEKHLDSIDHKPRGWWNSWISNTDY